MKVWIVGEGENNEGISSLSIFKTKEKAIEYYNEHNPPKYKCDFIEVWEQEVVE